MLGLNPGAQYSRDNLLMIGKKQVCSPTISTIASIVSCCLSDLIWWFKSCIFLSFVFLSHALMS